MLPPAQKASILGATGGGGGGGSGGGPQPTNLTIKKVASQDKLRGEQKEQQRKSTSPAPPSQDEIKQKTVSVTCMYIHCTSTCMYMYMLPPLLVLRSSSWFPITVAICKV